MIRNAGGRARNAVFDAAFLDTALDITDLIVIHHTSMFEIYCMNEAKRDSYWLLMLDCGLTLGTDERFVKVLDERSATELAKYDTKNFCFTEYVIAFLRCIHSRSVVKG